MSERETILNDLRKLSCRQRSQILFRMVAMWLSETQFLNGRTTAESGLETVQRLIGKVKEK